MNTAATKPLSFTPCPADPTPRQLTLAVGRAYAAWSALQERRIHPDGDFDAKHRWFPSDDERRDCCRSIRSPSARFPYSLIKHCRSVEHVAARFRVMETLLRRRIVLEKPRRVVVQADHYKLVALLHDGRMVSVFDGRTEYRIGVTLREACKPYHEGGYYCYPDVDVFYEQHIRDLFPGDAELLGADRLAVLRVRPAGRKVCYEGGKVAFSALTPVEVVRIIDATDCW